MLKGSVHLTLLMGAVVPLPVPKPVTEALESVDVGRAAEERPFRFPVQNVVRPHVNFRGYCGTVAAGSVNVGDELVALRSQPIEIPRAKSPMAIW